MFLHANVDIGYGPLDRVFVSPRVHRLHHAMRSDLHDQNYGVYLSIWDTIFGTFRQVPDRAIETGVEGFPSEPTGAWVQMPLTFLRQFAFPVTQAAQTLRDAFTVRERT
jgi:sterol desaturase/sphingolipid hydroxylase (fatty acid hydroxylase superfamily)